MRSHETAEASASNVLIVKDGTIIAVTNPGVRVGSKDVIARGVCHGVGASATLRIGYGERQRSWMGPPSRWLTVTFQWATVGAVTMGFPFLAAGVLVGRMA